MINLDGVKIDFDARVPMRDGTLLSADVYRPAAPGQYPVLLARTPYTKSTDAVVEAACQYARAGFVVVYMDVRGRGDSDGVFVPYRNDGQDGYDAVEWCAAQSWSNGNVGTFGGSYPGRIQWLTAVLRPPHLRAMFVAVSPSDPFVETPTGTPGPFHLCWLHYVSGRTNQPMGAVNWSAAYEHLPLLTMDEAAGRISPHWREQLAHPTLDEWWDHICYQNRFDQVDVPVLHVSGWYDDEQIGTPLNFIGMMARGRTEQARRHQKMIMGPWGHAINASQKLGEVDFGAQSIIDLRGFVARWFKQWLTDEATGIDTEPPTRLFVMGINQWRDETDYPLARTQWTPYYFHSGGQANSRYGDGVLTTALPTAEPHDTFEYDPARPVPFISEPTSSQIGGPDDYAAVEQRGDVLCYTTPPLEADLEVTGPIRVILFAASSAPDTDFTAKLVDVHPTGFAQRLCDGIVRARYRDSMANPTRIEPGKVYRYEIDCWHTCNVFRAGHRIRVEISSSAFPKYDRNPNTGGDLATETRLVVATQRILHDAAHPSHVLLPIIPV